MVNVRAFARRHSDSLIVLAEVLLPMIALAAMLWTILGRYEPVALLLNLIAGVFFSVWIVAMVAGRIRLRARGRRKEPSSADRWITLVGSVAGACGFAISYLPRSITFALDGDWLRATLVVSLTAAFILWTTHTIRNLFRGSSSQAGAGRNAQNAS